MFKQIYLASIDSTNNYCKKNYKKLTSPAVIVVDRQTAGRGRFKRKWYSAKGGVYFSILYKDLPLNIINRNLSIKVAKIIGNFLKHFRLKTTIKKPNDVLVNGKKIAGILCESKTKGRQVEYLVVGIGLNVNQKIFPAHLQNEATSITIETGRKYNISEIIKNLTQLLEEKLCL